ncbi:hypothetical protein BAUCODRAFT_428063 [Baudoinia panamericana UAMH 10762]|uniref:Uncharacterized protein n=1 Tax=Baudoinia panamericana (strain UAMH 10762) TaxID=717646 RepID=M2LV67_BAUPA|nr:uncharacterized protein BAUCODRAFT_428063 [Baudoinia panamericana UAMH 10762]EMC98492.1 hypothetical protein BAUCODRAFT_428063 [Baudoinia panamericana UAMH 10762]
MPAQFGVTQAVVILGQQTYTAHPAPGSGGEIVVGNATLTPGAPATTINGNAISAATAALVLDSMYTVPLSVSETTAPRAVVTLNGQVLTAVQTASTDILINGAVLTPGGAGASLYGVAVSALFRGSSGDGLVVGRNTTVPLSSASSAANSSASATTGSTSASSTQASTAMTSHASLTAITATTSGLTATSAAATSGADTLSKQMLLGWTAALSLALAAGCSVGS